MTENGWPDDSVYSPGVLKSVTVKVLLHCIWITRGPHTADKIVGKSTQSRGMA